MITTDSLLSECRKLLAAWDDFTRDNFDRTLKLENGTVVHLSGMTPMAEALRQAADLIEELQCALAPGGSAEAPD